MKFMVDENVGPGVAKWLNSVGFEVYSIYDETPGISDEEILQKAFSENYIVITSDKDFGELVYKNKMPHRGIVLLRLMNESTANKIRMLESLFEQFQSFLENRFVVLTEGGIRMY